MSMMPMEERPDKWGRLPSQQQRYPVDMNNGNYSPWPQQLPQQQPPQKPKGGGLFGSGKLQTKDIIGMILGTIGDGIAMNNGQRPTAAPMMMQRFQDQREQAAQQEEEQRLIQVAKAAGYGDNQAPAVVAGMSLPQVEKPTNMQREYEYLKENHPDRAAPYLERQTDNSMWRQSDDGQWYRVEKGGQSALPTKPVGKLTPISGGSPNSAPPQPQQHRVVTSRAQYNEMVRQKGKAWTDNYLRSYNVTIED